ncbi:hypothetical protein GF312_09715, partial [Candidatus Poribacteria bacterium]|nr:hypothetical protein [Candidatus Poribacteria bacterium]
LSGEKFLSKYTRNKYLLVIVASVIAIQICIIYITPLNKILGLVQLGLKDWIIVTIAVSLCLIPVENFADKIFVNKKQKDDINNINDIPDMEKDHLENEEDE